MSNQMNKKILQEKIKEIQNLYTSSEAPWIIGFSGGKDSTATVQLIYIALKNLPQDLLKKDVWVISSDTLVEIPTVVARVKGSLENLDQAAKRDNLPIKAKQISPDVDSTFFVNLIGRGYPSPTRNFRWCTDRLKIQPTSKFIQKNIDMYGEVIVILGARKKESMSRAQAMNNYQIKDSLLKRHSTLKSAFVYTPIEEWDLDDVWTFLHNFDSPWGDDNKDLVRMYKKAGGDECPLVVDSSTPSCGNSRFGCWVCTVVEQDKSIQGFIENGESWLKPMAEFRNYIKELREQREEHRIPDSSRTGGYGPFKLTTRMEILEKLLIVEKSMQDTHGEKLVSQEELWAIQKLWKYDGDHEDTVKRTYEQIFGKEDTVFQFRDIEIKKDDDDSYHLLDLCAQYNVSNDLVQRLLFIEQDFTKMRRRKGLFQRIDNEFAREVSNAIE